MIEAAPLPVIPWDDVETLVKTGLPVREIADRLGMSDEFERIKRQVTRKGWQPRRILADAKKHLDTLKSELVPNVPNAQDVLSQTGNDTRSKLGIAANKAAGRISQMDPDEIIECSPKLKDITSVASTVHGWDKQGSSGQTIVNIAFLSDTAYASPCDSLPSSEAFDALD